VSNAPQPAAPANPPPAPRGDGTDVRRLGLTRGRLGDLYHLLLTTSWSRLFAMLFVLYIAVNAVFALGYMIEPDAIENARPRSFYDAFFFSVQTMATIGYGKMVPHTTFANTLVTLEALMGLMGFAMATGLVFAKFSRPTARIMFSRVAVVAKREGVESLMFRMGNERTNQVVEATLSLVLVRRETTAEGETLRRVHDLKLVRARTAVFTLTWTVIHPITPDSPLYGQTAETLRAVEATIVASFLGLDETFSQSVHARHTYRADELVWNARFIDLFQIAPNGERQIDYAKFHDTAPL
jgi:inward rectifier potassium channel